MCKLQRATSATEPVTEAIAIPSTSALSPPCAHQLSESQPTIGVATDAPMAVAREEVEAAIARARRRGEQQHARER